jgi:hypothetical protein
MKMEEIKSGNWDSSFSVVTWRRDERPRSHGSISGEGFSFLPLLPYLSVQTGCRTHPGSCFVGVVDSECIELCCHYMVFVNGTVLRNSIEKGSPCKRNSLSAMREKNPPPPFYQRCEGPKHSLLCSHQPRH